MTTNPSIWRIEGNELVEQPMMQEPVLETSLTDDLGNEHKREEHAAYYKHLASLRRYPHNLQNHLKGKDLREGEHFRLQHQWFVKSYPDLGSWENCTEDEYAYTNHERKRIIALPISQPEQPISEEGKEVELMNCPFCGGRSIIEQTGNKQLTIKCTECTVQRTQKVLRYSLDWLRTTMISQWNTRTPSQEAIEVLDWIAYQHDKEKGFLFTLIYGNYYYADDDEGDNPMDGKELYQLYTEHKKSKQ